MSWGTCYSGSNNIFKSAPPLMSDGRNFTRWVPGREIDRELKKKYQINTNSKYRQFLISNSDNIIKFNQLEACNDCRCCPYFKNQNQTPNTPFLYKSCLQDNKPFGYESSDLKNLYLTRNRLAILQNLPISFELN